MFYCSTRIKYQLFQDGCQHFRHQSYLIEKKNLKFLKIMTLASIKVDYNILYIDSAMKLTKKI